MEMDGQTCPDRPHFGREAATLMDKSLKNAQNVLTMANFKPDAGYATLAQVEAYWEALRGDRVMPKRGDIDPRGIDRALENAFILERIAPGVARMRVAGTHLSDLMGMEVRGMPLTALFTPETRQELSDGLEEVFQMPAIGRLDIEAAAGNGQPALVGRMLILPLKSDLGDVSRILGCLITHGDIGIGPRRFTVTRQDIRPITTGVGAAPPDAVPLSKTAPPSRPPGLAAPEVPFEHTGKSSNRPPYLRLVKSDD